MVKVLMIVIAVMAVITAVLMILLLNQERKYQKEKAVNAEQKAEQLEENLVHKKEQNKRYADFKKENEEVVSGVIAGNHDAVDKLMQNITESGRKRNSGSKG